VPSRGPTRSAGGHRRSLALRDGPLVGVSFVRSRGPPPHDEAAGERRRDNGRLASLAVLLRATGQHEAQSQTLSRRVGRCRQGARSRSPLYDTARELVTQKGVGERADLLWRELQRQTATIVTPVAVPQPQVTDEIVMPAVAAALTQPCPLTPLTLADFALPLKRTGRRPLAPHENQLSLAF
jgi:hypothetical protein